MIKPLLDPKLLDDVVPLETAAMGDRELLLYFIARTNLRLDKLEVWQNDMTAFRAEVLAAGKANAKWTAIVVSIVMSAMDVVIHVSLAHFGIIK